MLGFREERRDLLRQGGTMTTEVKVYGPGCRRCQATAAMVEELARRLEISVTIERVTSPMEIARAGVISTPGLSVDGRLLHSGGLPDGESLANWRRG
jgi:Thioredoxin domain